MSPRPQPPAARAAQHPGQQPRLDTLRRTPYRNHQVATSGTVRRPSPKSRPSDHGEGRSHRLHRHGNTVHHPASREPPESPRTTPLTTQAAPAVDTYNVGRQLAARARPGTDPSVTGCGPGSYSPRRTAACSPTCWSAGAARACPCWSGRSDTTAPRSQAGPTPSRALPAGPRSPRGRGARHQARRGISPGQQDDHDHRHG